MEPPSELVTAPGLRKKRWCRKRGKGIERETEMRVGVEDNG